MKRFLIYILLASAAVSCHIEMPSKPVAKFRFTPENGCQAPCNVTFTSESENAVSVQWDFNDGSPVSTITPVTHEFIAGKIYEVKLIVKGVDGGSSGETRSVKIDAAAASAPEADFKYTVTNDTIASTTVTFNNQSKNALTYLWDFGVPGVTTDTSTAQNPIYTYANAGSYEVTLKATNGQNVTDTQTYTIKVKAPAASVDAIKISGGSNFTTDIVVDNDGNIYVCGEAAGPIQFGNNKNYESTAGSKDFFVAKYNSAMICQWAVLSGSSADDHANGLALDGSGNIYVTGFLAGALDGTTPKGGLDGFVEKFNPDGVRQWIKTFGGPGEDQGRSIGFFDNKLYLTGHISGNTQTSNIEFGANTLSANGKDGFFAVLNPSTGEFGLPTILGGADTQLPEDMTIDMEGNAYIAGGFAGSISFPGIAQAITAAGGSDVFVAKLPVNSNQFQWARRLGSGKDDFAYDIVVDASKNVYVTGMHTGELKDLSLPQSTFENVYLGKWNANGEVQLGKNGFNELKPDYHGGIALSMNGNIMIAGSFEDNARFPMASDTQVSGRGNTDILIAEVGSSGLNATGWIPKSDGGTGNDRVNRICVALGNVYATGWFRGSATFNGVQLGGVANVDHTFIVRYKL